MREITWKRSTALNGERVTIDAFVGARRVGQIASAADAEGRRAWRVWHGDEAPRGHLGGLHRTVPLAKTEIRRRLAEISPLPV